MGHIQYLHDNTTTFSIVVIPRYTLACTHTHTHTCTHTRTHAHTHAHMHTYNTRTHAHIQHTHTHTHAHMHTHTHTCTHTHAHTHMHTHTQSSANAAVMKLDTTSWASSSSMWPSPILRRARHCKTYYSCSEAGGREDGGGRVCETFCTKSCETRTSESIMSEGVRECVCV